MEECGEEEGAPRSVELRCPACNYFLVQVTGVESGLFRLFCKNRHCRRQCWFVITDGLLKSSSLGEIAIGALEKPARKL